MPRFDKTGPAGKGSMTGRGMGSCSGNKQNSLPQRGVGRGMGQGRGRSVGRGMGIGRGMGPRNRGIK